MISLFSILCLLSLCSATVVIDETLSFFRTSSSEEFNVSSYQDGSIVQVELQIKTDQITSSLSLYASLEAELDSLRLSDFFHKDPTDLENYDLDAMLDSRKKQYVNLKKEAGQDILYLTAFKFDPFTRRYNVPYAITVTEGSQYLCEPCLNGETPNEQCYCPNCQDNNKSGKICSRQINTISNNITTNILQYEKYFYSIPNLETTTIEISVSQGFGEFYIQFEEFQNQVADYFNYHSFQNGFGHAYILNQFGIKLAIDPQGKKTLITVINYSSDAELNLIYYNSDSNRLSGVNILSLILGIVGGIILLFVIITAIYALKKSRSNHARIQSQLSKKLSDSQIDRYFPLVHFGNILSKEEDQSSMNNLSKQGVDCIICLQTILSHDDIRIGYCCHYFHANCLIGWFNKQRNCPFCRKDYSKQSTLKYYTELCSRNNHRQLQNQELARAIYRERNTWFKIQNID